MPESNIDPTILEGKDPPLKILVAPKEKVAQLGNEWAVPGIYVLFGPGTKKGNYWVRVGRAGPGTLKKRILAHTDQNKKSKIKDLWSEAILVKRTVGNGFNSAETGYLEGVLATAFRNAVEAELSEGKKDKDETLDEWEIEDLAPIVDVVQRVIRLRGYSLSGDYNQPGSEESTHYSKSLLPSDLVASGVLAPGGELVPTLKGYQEVAAVSEEGTILVGDKEFPSLTAAAQALTGYPISGWSFWGIKEKDGTTRKLSDVRDDIANVTEEADVGESSLREEVGSSGSEAPSSKGGLATQGLEVGPESEAKAPKRDGAGELFPLLERRLLKVGGKLVGQTGGDIYEAFVTQEGRIDFQGSIGSPSGLAGAICGHPRNGWKFWHKGTKRGPTLSELKEKGEDARS